MSHVLGMISSAKDLYYSAKEIDHKKDTIKDLSTATSAVKSIITFPFTVWGKARNMVTKPLAEKIIDLTSWAGICPFIDSEKSLEKNTKELTEKCKDCMKKLVFEDEKNLDVLLTLLNPMTTSLGYSKTLLNGLNCFSNGSLEALLDKSLDAAGVTKQLEKLIYAACKVVNDTKKTAAKNLVQTALNFTVDASVIFTLGKFSIFLDPSRIENIGYLKKMVTGLQVATLGYIYGPTAFHATKLAHQTLKAKNDMTAVREALKDFNFTGMEKVPQPLIEAAIFSLIDMGVLPTTDLKTILSAISTVLR